MYEAHYGLSAKPFQLSPDARFLFASRGHSRAMAYLLYGLHQGEGFIVITGEVGAGKTTIARDLTLKMASQNVVVGHVVSTQIEPDDTVRMVAAAFGVADQNSKAMLLKAIERFLTDCHRQGKRALLLVDEVQNLPVASLEELRMLSNFQLGEKCLLQTFLLGQPEFRRVLHSPQMEQLRQRVIATSHLGSMEEEETRSYIQHRLETAGWKSDPTFTSDIFPEIHRFAGGIPRKINIVCDRLLLKGYIESKHSLTGQDLAEVLDELKQEFAPPPGQMT
jgi:general secretion pathway protein A